MKGFDVVYLTEGIGQDQNDSIFTGERKKDPWPTNNFLLQSSISGSIKILSPPFPLWLSVASEERRNRSHSNAK